MGKIKVNFSQLNDAIKNAGNVAIKLETYGDFVYDQNYSKIANLPGGTTYYTQDAASKIKNKRDDVTNRVAKKFANYATSLTNFRDSVEAADVRVKNYISSEAKTFAEEHGISCGPIESAWRWLCDGVSSILNDSAIGQWINNSLRKVGDWFSNRWDDLKQWYAFDGGEFVVNFILGVAAVAAGIFTILTAGVGVVAFFAIVGAVIGIANAIVQIGTSVDALINHDKDPAWARRCAKDKKVSSLLDTYFPDSKVAHVIGQTIDTVEGICAVVEVTDGLTKAYTKITGKDTMFQKYLGAGGVLDSAFVKYTGDEAKQMCQYNALAGRWEKLDANKNVILGVDGKPVTVDFSSRKSIKKNNLKWDFKTGMDNLKTEIFGEKMWKHYGNMVGEDISKGLTTANSNVKNVVNYVKDLKKLDINNGIKKVTSDTMSSIAEALHNHYGDVKYNNPELKPFVNSAISSVRGMTVAGAETWNVGIEYIKEISGFEKMTDIVKSQKDISELKVPEKLKTFLHAGVFVDDTKKLYDHYNSVQNKSGKDVAEDITNIVTQDIAPVEKLKKYIEKNKELWESSVNLGKTVFSN